MRVVVRETRGSRMSPRSYGWPWNRQALAESGVMLSTKGVVIESFQYQTTAVNLAVGSLAYSVVEFVTDRFAFGNSTLALSPSANLRGRTARSSSWDLFGIPLRSIRSQSNSNTRFTLACFTELDLPDRDWKYSFRSVSLLSRPEHLARSYTLGHSRSLFSDSDSGN